MSLAGRQSNLGDEYQLCVALHWTIKLLSDNDIDFIQVDSTGIPDRGYVISIDDIVVVYKNGRTRYMQAKKNSPDHRAWSFSQLKEELVKAREQLTNDENGEVEFYSRTPFGEFQRLVTTCQHIPSYDVFKQTAGKNQQGYLNKLATAIGCSEEDSFGFAKRILFGAHITIEDWQNQNLRALESQVARAADAIPYLKELLTDHESSLKHGKAQITRDGAIRKLSEHGIVQAPNKNISEILEAFSSASQIGRDWIRTIGGEQIVRSELGKLIALIEEGKQRILLTEGAGTGKTCILLDLADYIEGERSEDWGLLFIKGDHFTTSQSESNLADRGLPEDLVGLCARLSENRRVVVIVDSLDVLSLNRDHDSLRLFIGLISRLSAINNVTTISACRSFDLDYDPSLRGISWDHRVRIGLLDYEETIIPLLDKWQIDHSSFSKSLIEVLRVPQNLRLFKQVVDSGATPQIASTYALYDIFVQEVVVQKDSLGSSALEGLYRMANHLRSRRSQRCSKDILRLGESTVRELVSQEVLYEESSQSVGFSHQTLLDCLTVRAVIAEEQTLKDFILSQHQLPFIRPFVRAFLFYLRAHQPDQFSRQVVQAISEVEVRYHVKRLICESLCEIAPQEEDWPLFRRLYNSYPELLKRTFLRLETMGAANGSAWFVFLSENWLPLVISSNDNEQRKVWLRLFLQSAACWMNVMPLETIELWLRAIAESWFDHRWAAKIISRQFRDFRFKRESAVREVFEAFLSSCEIEQDKDDYYVANTISLWVEATHSGDDLVWLYMNKKIQHQPDDAADYLWNAHRGLRSQPHTFYSEDFLKERLKASDELLDNAISALVQWGQPQHGRALSPLLDETSWIVKHSQEGIPHFVDDLSFFYSQVERAVQSRAATNDTWWQNNVQFLLDSEEDAVAYLAIQTCSKNLANNLPQIEQCLQNKSLLFDSRLDDEIGELIRNAYPYISADAQEETQKLILERCNTPDINSYLEGSNLRAGYSLLRWIPAYLRTIEIQAIYDDYRKEYGEEDLQPRMYLTGGVRSISPLVSDTVSNISDYSILRLLRYYDGDWSISTTIKEISYADPERFLNLLSQLFQKNIDRRYASAILEGVSQHLRCRFGTLGLVKDLKMIQPLPNGEYIAEKSVYVLENYAFLFEDRKIAAEVLLGCCDVASVGQLADRLTFLLLRLLSQKARPQINESGVELRDVQFTTSRSYLSIVAHSALTLYNRLLEEGVSPPPLLHSIIKMQSSHKQSCMDIFVVARLNYTIHKEPNFGWQILNNILDTAGFLPWREVEKIFYYNYERNFNQVQRYLSVLAEQMIEKTGEVWGRISALCSLAGHISQDDFFAELSTQNSSANEGAAQVFCSNLNHQQSQNDCRDGIERFLEQSTPCTKALKKIDRCLFKDCITHVDHHLSHAYIDACSRVGDSIDPFFFSRWLATESRSNPSAVLPLLEKLTAYIRREDTVVSIHRTREVMTALLEVEREADELDDSDVIERTILLQDQLLELDIYEMNKFLDSSARA